MKLTDIANSQALAYAYKASAKHNIKKEKDNISVRLINKLKTKK